MQLFDRRIEESNLQLWSYFDECIPVTATAQSNPKSICILRTVPWMSSDLRLPFCLALENEKSPWNQKLQSVWVCSMFCFWIRELKQHFGAHWNLLFQAVSTWSLDISCQGGGSRTLNVTQNVLIRFWMMLAVSTHCKESFSRAWQVDQWGRLNAKINGL